MPAHTFVSSVAVAARRAAARSLCCSTPSLAAAASSPAPALTSPLLSASIEDLVKRLDAGEWTAAQVVEAYIARQEQHKNLNAITVSTHEQARRRAEELDHAAGSQHTTDGSSSNESRSSSTRRDLEGGTSGASGSSGEGNRGALEQGAAAGHESRRLWGVPIAVKDNFCTKDIRTTCASKVLANFIPPYSATVVRKIEAAGAIVLGKANMDEFAMGSHSTTSAFGPPLNPWHLKPELDQCLVSGGSSGGSAVAVAAGLAVASLGSDTGGSVRLPASYCGVVGFKPSYGVASRHGLVAYASSLDTPGVLARSVADAALVAEVISGEDPHDSTTCASSSLSSAPLPHTGSLHGLVVGVPEEYFIEELPGFVGDLWEQGVAWLQAAGVTVRRVSLPHTRLALPAYYIIALAEASSNLARYDGMEYGYRAGPAKDFSTLSQFYSANRGGSFGEEVLRRIVCGTFVLSRASHESYYVQAQRVRRLVAQDFAAVFREQGVHALLCPTAPRPAPTLHAARTMDLLSGYASDVFTVPSSLAGLPAVSVPCGLSPEGLPLGLQVIADRFQERTVLSVARALETGAQFTPLAFP